MYVNGKIRPVETIPGMGQGKENYIDNALNYDVL
jgi:hypothetical protein